MNAFFDSLNLRPGERRLIVIVAIVTFVVLNFLFVWPHSKKWKTSLTELDAAKTELVDYQATVAELDSTSLELTSVESGGATLLNDAEPEHLLRTIQNETTRHGVNVQRYDGQSESALGTNNLFIERMLPIQYINTADTNLVALLVSVGSGNSLIRIRDLTISTDPSRTKLHGRITFVASYRGSLKKESTGFKGGLK
ncbi:MAG: hypothetical protein ACI9VS_001194 [Candidatus Binatia bacterium]|jgi:hypothetical protein